MTMAESARERDLYKYYQPWLDVQALGNVPIDQPAARSGRHTHTAHSSHDKALTAFAQLATLRLNVRRGMVSLIDTTQQLILAEATRSLSLVDDHRHAPDDHIWLGNVAIPRADGVDDHTFGSTYTARDQDGQEYTTEALVVPDLRLDHRFKNRSYVLAEGGVRFYAGVPIITRTGKRIGVYAVSDAKPRHGLSIDELTFMQDVALTVFEHLETVKSRSDRDRGERMVRGLASFIHGVSTLKNQTDHPNPEVQPWVETSPTSEHSATSPSHTRHGQESINPVLTAPDNSFDPVKPSVTDSKAGSTLESSETRFSTETDASNPPDSKSDLDVREIFVQAAQIMRKSTKADGCVFFDASSGIFSDDATTSIEATDTYSTMYDRVQASERDTDRFESPQERRRRSTTSSSSNQDSDSLSTGAQTSERRSPPCQVLGTSVKGSRSSILPGLVMSEDELKKFFQQYPSGKLFNVSKEGSISSGDDSLSEETAAGSSRRSQSRNQRKGRKRSAKLLPSIMLKLPPGVRSIIFFPLWDYTQNRWFAGAFIWSNRIGRLSNPDDEMPYLKAFGSCIMSEVASMEALNTNYAKTTFIASVSHELRSPLHGILGSIEFLEDTMTTAYQMNLIGSIETCGKTLLDTIDHLLDYAKINNLTKIISRKASRPSLKSPERPVAGLAGSQTTRSTVFDLACLVEDVVEAVFAGQTFRKTQPRGQIGDHRMRDAIDQMQSLALDDTLTTEEAIQAATDKFSGKVTVVLNVTKNTNWFVRSQPGALRRIIMNIFGNAIKYCEVGTIEANLDITSMGKSNIGVEFTVKDTGRGMSKEFMANHLFRAFTQEDSFSYGTGLGLSIVKQIVDSLTGKIDVKSQKGVGTEVRIALKLPRVERPPHGSDDDILTLACQTTNGLTMCLLNPSQGDMSEQKRIQTTELSQSMAKTCREWFGINFVEGSSMDADADIFYYAEPPPVEYLLAHHSERRACGKTGREVVLLITCTNAFEAASLRASGVQHLTGLGRVIEVISQPCGPRKLAKILLQYLRRVDVVNPLNSPKDSATSTLEATVTIEAKERAANTEWVTSSTVYDPTVQKHRPSIDTFRWKSDPPSGGSGVITQGVENVLEWGKVKAGDVPGSVGNSSTFGNESLPPGVPGSPSHLPGPGHESSDVPYILLVDDNPINLKLLVTFMKKIQVPYLQAVNGLEALEKFKSSSRRVDYVFMDISMPIMDGITSTRKIREYERQVEATPSTVIALTGLASGHVQEEAYDAGFSHFMAKPVSFKVLKQLIERRR